METDTLVRISALAKKAGVTPRTIRFYVQKGLIPKPVQTQKNMALYHLDCVSKIRAIKQAQARRFMPLVVIRQILEENNYDYNALEAPEQTRGSKFDTSSTLVKEEGKSRQRVPEATLAMLEKKNGSIGHSAKKGKKNIPRPANGLSVFLKY